MTELCLGTFLAFVFYRFLSRLQYPQAEGIFPRNLTPQTSNGAGSGRI